MDAAQIKQRCPSAEFVCRAKLPFHRLAFTRRSVRRGCGVADVLRDKTKHVWGVVYKLVETELPALDKDEDFRPGRPDNQNNYTRKNCHVWHEGDENSPILVAIYRGHPEPNPPLPNWDYKNLIVTGARHWKLPAYYIQELEAIRIE